MISTCRPERSKTDEEDGLLGVDDAWGDDPCVVGVEGPHIFSQRSKCNTRNIGLEILRDDEAPADTVGLANAESDAVLCMADFTTGDRVRNADFMDQHLTRGKGRWTTEFQLYTLKNDYYLS